MLLAIVSLSVLLAGVARAHGDHGGHEPHGGHRQYIAPEGADWATKHMIEEHHITSFDAGSFFSLHDYDSSGEWTPQDILKTYGLKDASTRHISQEEKDRAVRQVIELYDRDHSGTVSFSEYTEGEAQGIKLPDFAFGPGHHGDDEYEYEIHHFELYHDQDTKPEDLTHPEDIEHFRKHEEEERAWLMRERLDEMPIIEENIPSKFLRHG